MSTMPMKNNFNLDGLLGNPALQIGLGILGANTPGATTGQAIGRGGMMGLQSLAQQQREAMMQKVRDEQIKVQQQRNSQIQSQMDLEAEQRAASKAALDNLVKDRPDLAPIAAIDAKAALKMAFPQASSADPFTDKITDENGNVYLWNRRETDPQKALTPFMVDGKPFTEARYSPNLLGNVEYSKEYGKARATPTDMEPGVIQKKSDIIDRLNNVLPPNIPKLQEGQPQSNPWQIPPEVQAQRDAKARQLIASEGGQGNMGITPPMPYNLPTGGIKVPTKAEEAASVKKATMDAETKQNAITDLPNVLSKAERSIKYIDEMIGSADGKIKPHPGFESYVGATLKPFASKIHGTNEASFKQRELQLSGSAFLEAFESLKGGGHITEIEGEKATQAIQRMNNAVNEEEYIKAGREFQEVLRGGIEKAKNAAGVSNNLNPATTPTKPPMKGQIIDGYKYKGGNSSDPNNWEEQ